MKNSKVIPSDHIALQHRLIVIDLSLKVKDKPRKKLQGSKKIKWFKLKDDMLRRQFMEKVLGDIEHEIGDINGWWEQTVEIMLRQGREILGETSGKIWENKETWWFNEEVQNVTRSKKEAKKKWDETQAEEDKLIYKERSKEAKRAVAIAKSEAYDQLYQALDTKEGEGKIFNIAKLRNKSTKDITHIKQIKEEDGEVIKKEEDIIKRWKKYFEKLLNEENERQIRDVGNPNLGLVTEISREEVKCALAKMKNGKAVGPDGIPAEAWKALGEQGIDVLWRLMRKIMEFETIPEKWRESILVPIFKEKGDIQKCENYRGIKLMSHTLKIFERIMDSRLRQEVRLGKQQLGFMRGVGTVDAIFSLRQLMEKCREKQKVLHMVSIDLEKA